MFGYQCIKCSQTRLTSHEYTASSLNDNTRRDTNTDNTRGDINTDNTQRDINTAACRTQDTDSNPVKPTQLPGIHTIFRTGFSVSIGECDECDECDSPTKKGSKCVKNIKSTSNHSTVEESPSVEFKKQDSLSILQNDDNLAAHSSTSKNYVTCRTCDTKMAISEPLSERLAEYIRNHTGDKSSFRINTGEKSCSQVTETVHSPDHKETISFLCSKCGRAFSRRYNRDRHNDIFSGERTCSRDGHKKTKSS